MIQTFIHYASPSFVLPLQSICVSNSGGGYCRNFQNRTRSFRRQKNTPLDDLQVPYENSTIQAGIYPSSIFSHAYAECFLWACRTAGKLFWFCRTDVFGNTTLRYFQITREYVQSFYNRNLEIANHLSLYSS